MITLFFILMAVIFGRLAFFSIKLAWGLSKVLITFVLLPTILVGLLIAGLIRIALPVLIVIGVISLFKVR